jgi:hypothetical protein
MCVRARKTARLGCRWADLVALGLSVAAFTGCGTAEHQGGDATRNGRTPVSVDRAPIWDGTNYVTTTSGAGSFTLAAGSSVAPLVVNAADHAGVRRVLGHLRADLQRVTGTQPALSMDTIPSGAREVVIVGTLGRSELVDGLVTSGKLDVTGVTGKWETFVVQVVEAPMANVDRALVIAGSDKRGTIYGIYDVSQRIGVSPWYFWADVPSPRQTNLYVAAGRYASGEPKVKYRGIFINDENPALLGWVNQTYSGFNVRFYEKVFELMSRMRANYLWPAMWGKAFNADDAMNPTLADEYGIVMGTSHHEPMSRAQAEWASGGNTDAQWNYGADAARVRTFWQGGITRMGTRETYVTLGMRGNGDMPLEGLSVSLLQQIVSDQRNILQTVTGRNPNTIPQVWALYKEVQDFYDQGMQVPADVTLLFADDNWGNVRRLPDVGAPARAGGYGVYYHFDYVGDPRSYKWLNTNPIARVWEQMHLSYRKGVDRMWIVNVGDIKPMEFPTEFFLDFAWNPDAWPAERLPEYTRLWAERQFGAEHAAAIGDILTKYSKYNGRRKPELLGPETYSLVNYREAERIVADYNAIAAQAQAINDALPANARDAFFQLVLHPVKACANLNELYVTVAKNALYAAQGRASTNDLRTRAQALFQTDADLTRQYHTIANGKWNHMMEQTHIGYTTWDQPATNVMPAVQQLTVPAAASMGVAIEGNDGYFPMETGPAVLPELSPFEPQPSRQVIDVFNRGTTAFDVTVSAPETPGLTVMPASGRVEKELAVTVSADWTQVPLGRHEVPITLGGPNGANVVVTAVLNNPATPRPETVEGYVETNGYVSIEAARWTRVVNTAPITWQVIPDLGRTVSGVTPFPVTAPAQTPGGSSARLEYRMHLFESGEVRVNAYLSPTLAYHRTGLKYAISFDDAEPTVVDINADATNETWKQRVSDSVNLSTTTHMLAASGDHVLKFWAVDPGVVLQKLVVDTGGVKPSYLGPPASDARSGGVVIGGMGGMGTGGSGSGADGGMSTGGTSNPGGSGTTAGASNGAGNGSGASAGASAGGTTGTGADGSGATAPTGDDASDADDASGCGCTLPGRDVPNRSATALGALAILLWLARAQRKNRRALALH